jgi:hypothetical protein
MTPPDDDIDWRYSALVSSAAGFPIGVDDADEGGGALKVDHARPSADREFYRRLWIGVGSRRRSAR